ncbi:formin-like protein 16 [Phaseolus vulgaris]|uniref:formin-like protein 16 n=1 Tax=Phaseolus vulgaris TaxID=3885 RepID=UPI0035C96E2F
MAPYERELCGLFLGAKYNSARLIKEEFDVLALKKYIDSMSGKDKRKALLELAKLRGAKGTGSSSSTTEPIAVPPLSVAPAEGPKQGRKRRKLVKAFPSSAAAAAPSTEEESSGSPLIHRKRKLPAAEEGSPPPPSTQPAPKPTCLPSPCQQPSPASQPSSPPPAGQSLGPSAPPAGGASAHPGGLPLPLPTSTATAECALEKRVKELEHDKESLRSDFEAAQGFVDLMRGMVERARREYLAQVQETIKTEILMGQTVNSLDCEVVQLRAETSYLRQLNSQLVGELESTKEAAAAGEKKLEEVVGKLSEAKGQLEEAASSHAALTTEKNAAEASKQKLEAEKADLMNVGVDALTDGFELALEQI